MHLTGYIQLAATGTYTFQIDSDDGAKLFIDNNNLINDWADGSFRTHPTHTFINDTANSWHKITLDYYNKAVNGVDDTDGELRLWLTLPSGAQTCNIGSILTPSYGLPTSNKVFDSQVGDTSTTTSYGPKPDLGLVQSASADPTGLNLTSSSSYEAQGATGSFNRQTSKTLPGGGGSYAAPNTSTLIDEGLDPAWGDWSWDSTNSFNDTTNPDSGTQDTAWTINAAWAGLDIHNMSGIDTTPYNSVTFAMKGTNPQVGLNLMDTNDVALASQVTDLSQYGSLPDSHGYVTYTVPLSLLGGANKTVYGFMLQDITGAAQPTIYLDSVKFTNAPSSYTIMNEDLANGWGDWSWSSTNNFTDTTKPFVGTKDTSWAVTAAFGAIDVHNNNGSVNAAPYKTLSFELKNSDDNIPFVYAALMDTNDSPLGSWIDITHYAGAEDSNGYRLYTIPLSDLGATNKDVYGFALQDQTETTQPARYIDDVKLTTAATTAPATENYAYWGPTQEYANPCVQNSPAVSQAGLLHLKTEADPDGSGPLTGRTLETIYDDAGRPVATRYNSDPWTCTTYDSRGRVSQVVTPTINGRTGRTITYNYSVNGNPLVGSSTDSVAGTTTVNVDLLGRAVSSTDVFGNQSTVAYDNLGRISQQQSLNGTFVPTYNNLDQITSYAVDGTTYATLTYDSYGRIATTDYPQATNGTNHLKLTQVNRDTLQRVTGSAYTFSDGSTMNETVSLSAQKGLVTADSITQGGKTAGAAYQYDAVGRLTQATIDNWQYQYAFGAQDSSCSTIPGYNANANKDGNRTSYTVTNTSTSTSTTSTNCYNSADQLFTSSDSQIGTPTYDDHGNITQLAGNGTPIQFTYDASDQNTKIQQGNNWVEYTKDVGGNVLVKKEYRNGTLSKVYRNAGGTLETCDLVNQSTCSVLDKYIDLPGGVSLTVENGTPKYSVKNFHGDTSIEVASTGLPSTSVFLYDPFGQVVASNTFGTGISNLNNASDNPMGWASSPMRKAESMFSIPIIQMGARVYLPTLGRFTSMDPVEGGTDNAYAYVNDPVNEADYSGQWGFSLSSIVHAVVSVAKAVVHAVTAVVQAAARVAAVVYHAVATVTYHVARVIVNTAQRFTSAVTQRVQQTTHNVVTTASAIVTQHPKIVTGVALGLGIASMFTGVGEIAVGLEVVDIGVSEGALGLASDLTGFTATGLDLKACKSGDSGACLPGATGTAGAGMAILQTFTEFSPEVTLGIDFAKLLLGTFIYSRDSQSFSGN